FFHIAVSWANSFRGENGWLIYFMPLGGLAIALLYRVTRMRGVGTNRILDSIHEGDRLHIMLVPAVFISTVLTHLVGGSAGREGAALQIGGGLGAKIGRALRLDDKDMRIVTMCGMSAVFAALFGTPLTAAVFALEVISVGVLYYVALIPCLVSSITAFAISIAFGLSPTRFSVTVEPLAALTLLKVVVLAIACAVVSMLFCIALHKSEALAERSIKSAELRAVIGGTVLVVLTLLVGTEYNGAGEEMIVRAVNEGTAPDWAFFWKMLFTVVTIACGFKGGEIVPTFFIGATLGCVLGPVLGLPAGFAAAIALTAVFCGNVNCPVAAIILSVELFGSGELIYFSLACAISYMLSGYYGLYSHQKIIYSKTRAEFINRYAR
ncbi:MAG: chloride channel protein, partial [Oscillospiraceae bacterium]|nr:chloride channel protein [Oscillospiraceae bacterium]